jgi:type IV secretory pathway TrbL component
MQSSDDRHVRVGAESGAMKRIFAVLGVWIAASAMPAAAQPPRGSAMAAATIAAATGKERLGDKASDNQRVNDCRVPPEKRGPIRRPTECAQK